MSEFVASNGIVVGPGTSMAHAVNGVGISQPEFGALREFFQAEADERLGRWRWPENPDCVVYLDDGCAVVFDESYPVRQPDRIRRRYLEDPEGSLGWGEFAARAYFVAHPEPKPWHEASEGDIWSLTVNGAESAWVRRSEVWERVSDGVVLRNAPDSKGISDGHRIWPEVSS